MRISILQVITITLVGLVNIYTYGQGGALDPTFDFDGKVVTNFGQEEGIRSVKLQSDGKIIAGGYGSSLRVCRYNINGSFDNSFGISGTSTLLMGIYFDGGAVSIQSDDKILISGGIYFSPDTEDFIIARYTQNGLLDSSFNGTGINITSFGAIDGARDATLQQDGKAILVGFSRNSLDMDTMACIARYTLAGSLDSTFDLDGKISFPYNGIISAVTMQNDHKILVAGCVFNGSNLDFNIMRYNPDGQLDNSFGTAGEVITDFGFSNDNLFSVNTQADGKIIASGTSDNECALVRYNADGSLDLSFGIGGKITTSIGGGVLDAATSTAVQSDGKIYASGFSLTPGGDGEFVLVRYDVNGYLDPSFDSDGIVTTNIVPLELDAAASMILQPDGRIIVAGGSYNGNDVDFCIVRYLSGFNTNLPIVENDHFNILVYPNPINEYSTLQYTITNEQIITISVFDMTGKKIKTLKEHNNTLPGTYSISLNELNGLSSGSYLIAITSHSASKSIKFIK